MRWFIYGYFGRKNMGDEAICDVLVKTIHSIDPVAYVFVATKDPKALQPNFLPAYGSGSVPALSSIMGFIRNIPDVAIIGGGGLFNDQNPKGWLILLPMLAIALNSRLKKIPLGLLGVSVGPLKSKVSMRIVREIFCRADVVTLRDKKSFIWLDKCGCATRDFHLATDWAVPLVDMYANEALDEDLRKRIEALPQPRVGVNLFSGSRVGKNTEKMDRLRRECVATAMRKISAKKQVSWILLSCQGDEGTCDDQENSKLADLLEGISMEKMPLLPFHQYPALLKELDLVFAAKLHLIIIGAVAGCKVASMSYHDKIEGFLEEIQMAESFCNFYEPDIDKYYNILKSGLNSKNISRKTREKLQKNFKINVEALKTLMDKVLKKED